MLKTIKSEIGAKVSLFLYLIFILWFIFLQFNSNEFISNLFDDTYFILAIWGGFVILYIANKWGGLKSLFGKALLMFSFGLFAQSFGQLVYTYYFHFEEIEMPYPSIGDIGYFASVIFYIYGAYLLAKISGVQIKLKSFANLAISIVLPIIVLFISYTIFLQNYQFDWVQPVKIFLDFGYPLGQSIYLSIALLTYLLSRGFLGGLMKNKIFWILISLCFQYLADFIFLYRQNNGIWHTGDPSDFFYVSAYLLMTLSILQLNTVLKELQVNKK
jgi:hypothetical protein